MKTIAQTIKQERTAQGITQIALARQSRTTRGLISRLESGKYNPGLEVLERILEVLGAELQVRARYGIEAKYIKALAAYRSTRSKRDREVVTLYEQILIEDFLMKAPEIAEIVISSL